MRTETVGWNRQTLVKITVDLEKTETIGRVGFTAATGGMIGMHGANASLLVFALVSRDGEEWRLAGELMNLIRRGTYPWGEKTNAGSRPSI